MVTFLIRHIAVVHIEYEPTIIGFILLCKYAFRSTRFTANIFIMYRIGRGGSMAIGMFCHFTQITFQQGSIFTLHHFHTI